MPIRVKLTIGYGILVAAVLILMGGIHYAGNEKILWDQKDYSLKVAADILNTYLPLRTPSTLEVQKAVAAMIRENPDIEFKGILVEIYAPSRSPIFISSRSEEQKLPVGDAVWDKAFRGEMNLATVSVSPGAPPMRILTRPVFSRGKLSYLIQVGSSVQNIENAMGHFLLLNLFFIPTSILLVGIGGWYLTRKELRPLDAAAQTAQRISSGDLSHRIEVPQAGREIRQLTDAFNQMIIRLDSSFRQIKDFSDNVSHELRSPLAILKGQTELSLRRSRSEAEYRDVLSSNLEEILRLEKIVEKLLFLSKADRGEIPLHLTEINLRELTGWVRERFQLAAREKGVRIRDDGARTPVMIEGDEGLLRELLFNLVQNAVKFTPEEGEIAIAVEEEGDRVGLRVSDTGCGIPAEEIPRIADRFYQADKSRSSQGTGLGLSLCKWIVEAHHAELSMESTIGRGSRFTVTLPRKQIRTS